MSRRDFAKLETQAGHNCDEKQVRRAIEAGKLQVNADGTLDPAQVGCGWRRPQRNSQLRAVKPAAVKPARKTRGQKVKTQTLPPADAPEVSSFVGQRLKEAVANKADYDGKLKELEYRKRAGELIERSAVQSAVFDEFRAIRDGILNFPSRRSALIAAELGVEADRVAQVLTEHVHKLLATFTEPTGGLGD